MSISLFPTSSNTENHASQELHEFDDKIDFIEYWRSINKRKWAILGFALSIALLVAAIVFTMPPIYRSTVTLLIESSKSKVVSIEEVYGGFASGREHFTTQTELLSSQDVAIRTITELKLWEHPEFDPRKKTDSPIQKFLQAIGFSAEKEKKWDDESLTQAVLPGFQARLSVEPIRLSTLVKVHFESADQVLAAKVANTLAKVFIDADLDVRFQMTQKVSSWLNERMASVREKLDSSERQLQAYRDQNGIIDSKNLVQSGGGLQIQEITQRLVETRLRRAEAENAYNQIKSAGKGADLSSLPAVVRNANVSDAIKQQSEAERKLTEVSQRYGKEHPKYLQADGDQKTAQENLKRQIDTVVQSVTREYEVAKGTERMLEGTLNQAKGSIQGMNRKEGQLNILEREVDSNKQIYDLFLKRAKETNIASDLQSPVARVVNQAKVEGVPIKPKKSQIIVMTLLLSLIVGCLASLLIDFLDNTFKSTSDVESKLKVPVLTTLPLLPKKSSDRVSTAHMFFSEPQSLYTESIRTALTAVSLSYIDIKNRILLVTSSVPGEGKTTFSINLAIAHANTKKTLLIDADMRRPAVAKGLDLEQGGLGLSDFVSGTASLNDVIKKIPGTSLRVIGAGRLPPQPLELLLSARFKRALEVLSETYEIIVIDSPPVELVSDALILSKMVTGVVYVVKAASTPIQLARKGLTRIRRSEGKVLGVVLNHLDFQKAEKYYGEVSGYTSYGDGKYGHAYGDQAIKNEA